MWAKRHSSSTIHRYINTPVYLTNSLINPFIRGKKQDNIPYCWHCTMLIWFFFFSSIYLFNYLFLYSFICLFIYLFISLAIYFSIYSNTYSSLYSLSNHSFIHSPLYLSSHSVIHSLIYSFICSSGRIQSGRQMPLAE